VSSLPVILSFGVSDGTGASGIQADQLAIASMGCHPASVVTAIATLGIDSDWLPVEPDDVEAQARTVVQNMAVAAVKIGAIATVEQIRPIAEVLADFDSVPIVLDPVVDRFEDWAASDFIDALRELVFPQATVVTLSLAQARRMIAAADDDDLGEGFTATQCGRRITEWGASYVLLTDVDSDAALIVNSLFDDGGLVRSDTLPRIERPASSRFHGAGDTLSAALAGLLGQGTDIADAVQEASQYTAAALINAFEAGLGISIPDRLFWAGDDDEDEVPDAPQ
jgi:hydroxymethylpyrimidine/phosphomethylpyrimidine kinase